MYDLGVSDELIKTIPLLESPYREFVLDSITEGHHNNYDSITEFLRACAETYEDVCANDCPDLLS